MKQYIKWAGVGLAIAILLGGCNRTANIEKNKEEETSSTTPTNAGQPYEILVEPYRDGWEIIGYTGKGGALKLPDEIDGRPVLAIGDEAFFEVDDLIQIEIPDSVTYIGDYAFEGCIGLTELKIPDSVTEIGVWPFGNRDDVTAPAGSYAAAYMQENAEFRLIPQVMTEDTYDRLIQKLNDPSVLHEMNVSIEQISEFLGLDTGNSFPLYIHLEWDNLDETDQEYNRKRYPNLPNVSLYIVEQENPLSLNHSDKKQLMTYLLKGGYTYEQKIIDLKASGKVKTVSQHQQK